MAKDLESSLKVIAKSAGIILIGTILSKILLYVYRLIIGRYFGVEEYGRFSLALSIIGFISIFASWGLQSGVSRYVSYYRGKKDVRRIEGVIKTAIYLILPTSIILTIITYLTADLIAIKIFKDIMFSNMIKIMSLTIITVTISQVYIAYILAFEKIKQYSFIFNVIQHVMKVVSLIILIYLGFKVSSIALSYLIGTFVLMILSYKAYKKLQPVKIKPIYEIREVLNYSWPLIFFGVLLNIFGWVDTGMIGYFLNIEKVGLYNAAIPLGMIMLITFSLLIPIITPLINKNFAKKKLKLITQLSKQTSKWTFYINFPLVLLMIVFPEIIIKTTFGVNFLGATTTLAILSIGFFFLSLIQIPLVLIDMLKKSKLNLTNVIIILTINIILNYFLIKKYEIEGAAIATSISYFIYLIIVLLEVKKYLKFYPIHKDSIKAIISGIIAISIVLLIKKMITINIIGVIVLGSLFLIIYLILLVIMKCFDDQDKILMRGLIKKVYK